jgi:hypothetical protein
MENKNNSNWLTSLIFFADWFIFFGLLTFALPIAFPDFSPPWFAVLCGQGDTVYWGAAGGVFVPLYCTGSQSQIPFVVLFGINFFLALIPALIFYFPMQMVIGQMSPSDRPAQTPVKSGENASYFFEGKGYSSIDEMPPEGQAQYRVALSMFDDLDMDGVPDLFQGGVLDMLNGLQTFLKQAGPLKEEIKKLARQQQNGEITMKEFEDRLKELAARARQS